MPLAAVQAELAVQVLRWKPTLRMKVSKEILTREAEYSRSPQRVLASVEHEQRGFRRVVPKRVQPAQILIAHGSRVLHLDPEEPIGAIDDDVDFRARARAESN